MTDVDRSGEQAGAVVPRRRLTGRTRAILLAMLLLALIAIAAWLVHYATRGRFRESTDDAYVQADAVTVSPRIAGYVEQVYVADNQSVRAGAPLVRIDPRDYRAQTAQYRAQVDVARATGENIRASILEQRSTVAQARAEVAAAEADAAFSRGEADRYAPLAASGAETREKLASLRNQAAAAAATLAGRRAALAGAERRIASLGAQVRQAAAQGEAAQAQLAAADVNLASTIVRASVDGRVGDRTVRVGQFAQSGTRMMTIVPLSAIYVTANFKETQLGLMRPGQPATIEIDALPGVALRGHVESVAPGTGAQFSLLPPQNATGNFTKIVQRVPVRIAIDAGPDARRVLVPGLSVTVTVDTIGARGDLARIRDQEKRRHGR